MRVVDFVNAIEVIEGKALTLVCCLISDTLIVIYLKEGNRNE